MSLIPEGARLPQDHLPKAVAPVVSEDELLADMPELVPPHKLRLRQRNKVMKLAISLRSFLKEPEDGGDPVVDVDVDDLDDEELEKMLDVLASIDEFAESIATDSDAYGAWAQGKDYDVFSALLSRYSSAVGESTGSSN